MLCCCREHFSNHLSLTGYLPPSDDQIYSRIYRQRWPAFVSLPAGETAATSAIKAILKELEGDFTIYTDDQGSYKLL